ncbi:hypothetical protein TEQG_06664 [Trichophyton equinum CBS 127.97]|uniref:Uncharacterized protein n=1 Tax=Trichophyton equinum (strain ATCC MYA-4606 / CBS 127.97) TaxID=559882 RepID=F2Q0L3_TRIEC|nr:hypothetical protein TEQG_06664 [Trichophyton equinum CBS 127.97]
MSVQSYLVHGSSASECAGRKPVILSMRAGGRPSGYINGIRAVGEQALCPSSVSWSLVAGHSLPLGDARRDLIYLSPLAALHHLFPTAWIPGIFFFLLCVRLLRAACLASAAPPYNHNDAGSKLRRDDKFDIGLLARDIASRAPDTGPADSRRRQPPTLFTAVWFDGRVRLVQPLLWGVSWMLMCEIPGGSVEMGSQSLVALV